MTDCIHEADGTDRETTLSSYLSFAIVAVKNSSNHDLGIDAFAESGGMQRTSAADQHEPEQIVREWRKRGNPGYKGTMGPRSTGKGLTTGNSA